MERSDGKESGVLALGAGDGLRETAYRKLDIGEGWRLFPMALDEGLLGQGGRAYQRGYEPAEAVRTRLPATAPAAWLEAGKIEDPYYGMNNRELLWMEQKEWWYIRDVVLPTVEGQWTLSFEGVNYRAEVWLNDVQISRWEGSFLTKRIDLDPALLSEGKNRLAVRVRSQERAWEDGGQAGECGFQNSTGHIRTQGPTPQYAHGWNWSPHLIALGIWRPVTLEWHGVARFEDTRIHLELEESMEQGQIRFTGGVESLSTEGEALFIEMEITSPSGEVFTSSSSIGTVELGELLDIAVEATVDHPALWYPNGYGGQALYGIEVRLKREDGTVCAVRRRRAGFRRISFIPNTNDESVLVESGQSNRMWSIVGKPYPWTMVVNGKRIFSKGSNWCPVDNLYRDRAAHVRRLLELARDAHYVFLRVWGGGLTESEHFYDSCDELGILCLQEFWFACGSAPAMDCRVFLENAESELKRLRERTSIALWGGGNEFNPDNPENRGIIDRINELVEQVDGTREFRRGSPYRGDRHGGLVSTPHYTTNKYRDLLPGRRRLVLLRSECAVGRSPARPSNIHKFIPEASLWPIDWKQYQNHHAQRPEWEMVSRPFGEAADWEQALLYASVFHCIDSRLNMEFSRANKYESSGCWTWQLNASWPSFHREHVDWFGDPKPVYYWYGNACRPVIALADLERFVCYPGEQFSPDLVAVNDGHEAVNIVVEVLVHDYEGELLHRESCAGCVPPDGRLPLGRLDCAIPERLSGKALYLTLRTSVDGETVHRNTYYVAVSVDTIQQTAQPVGETLHLEYLGRRREVSAPHYFTLSEIVDEPTEHDREQKHAADAELEAVYTSIFDLRPDLLGKQLEVHLPGLSADDRVILNGRLIGSGQLDLEREWNYVADPLKWPFLPARYYAIPDELICERGNVLEIFLSGRRIAGRTDKRFGLTRMIHVRERTPPGLQAAIADYERQMTYFTPISKGPPAKLTLSSRTLSPDRILLELVNVSAVPAAFVVLDLVEEGDCRFLIEEGAFSALLPGEVFSTVVRIQGQLSPAARAEVRGLNFETLSIPLMTAKS